MYPLAGIMYLGIQVHYTRSLMSGQTMKAILSLGDQLPTTRFVS